MSANKFKEEFSQLLLQYTTFNPSLTPDLQSFLTHQQIVDSIRETLHSTLNLNFPNVSDADLKTPANEIVLTTPNAPDITKVKYDANDALSNRDQPLKSNVLLRIDMSDMDTSEIDTTPIADTSKKSMVSDVDRSSLGTVHEVLTDEQRKFRELLQSELSKLADSQRNSMYDTIEEARRQAQSVLDKIEEIRDLFAPELKPSRRFTSMLELPQSKSQTRQSIDGPSLNLRTTNQRRSMQAARRSITSQQKRTDSSVTPTSRLSSIRAPPCSPTDGSVVNKLKSYEKKLDPSSRSMSMSSLTLLGCKLSPCKPSPCKPKNPKYAHIQSTIPKPMPALKRKAAQ